LAIRVLLFVCTEVGWNRTGSKGKKQANATEMTVGFFEQGVQKKVTLLLLATIHYFVNYFMHNLCLCFHMEIRLFCGLWITFDFTVL